MSPYVSRDNLNERTSDWLGRIAPFNSHDFALADRSALMVIDMQTFFLTPGSPTFTEGGPAVMGNVRQLIDAFRQANRPVIYTRHVHDAALNDAGIMGWWWQGMCVDGTPESEVHPDIAPLPGEKVVAKHRYSAFYNTDLETVLRVLKVEDLVICGIMTNMCCESTARDAYYRDYRVHFLADATGSICEEMHLASLLNLALGFARITTTGKILKEVEALAAVAA
ncbi:MAG: cysteine hydrolase [Calditrichaeota bacterium]|nr:cysteine hydrolase [Calditrichota bacterium]